MSGLPQKYRGSNAGVHYRRIAGRFVGINGASPTTKYGAGFTVSRSGEGVWLVTFEKPMQQFVTARAWANDEDGGVYHTVDWVLSAANRTMTITHRQVAWASIASGPAAEDVVDEIGFDVTVAEADVIGAGV